MKVRGDGDVLVIARYIYPAKCRWFFENWHFKTQTRQEMDGPWERPPDGTPRKIKIFYERSLSRRWFYPWRPC